MKKQKKNSAVVVESYHFWAAVYFNGAQFYYCLKYYKLTEESLNKALSLKPNDALLYNF